ncbi:MAG: motility protein A [Defluviitaleaceae bacterium]|nr:motility protein A [Defluviitaleaceae bacterium]
MDIGSIIGLVMGVVFIVLSILISANFDILAVLRFVDAPSVMIVIGGSACSLLIAYPTSKITAAMKALKKVFQPPDLDPAEAITNIISLANMARKEGILALEETARSMKDKFLQKGIMLIVDGTDPELTRNILETELAYLENRHGSVRGVWDMAAALSPAWGMVGTVVGLVNMLHNMDDPNAVGPAMAVALITTMYGSLAANWVSIPFANKLKILGGDEVLMKSVLIEGMLAIQAGENPRIIEEKLKSFLPPAMRQDKEETPEG